MKEVVKRVFHAVLSVLKKILPRKTYWDVHSFLLNGANRLFGYTFALSGLDQKLYGLFGKKNGVFIEAGAADGLSQSNTLLLERKYKWRGILVEPIPNNYRKCKKYRSNSAVFNCILCSFENDGEVKTITEGNLLSIVDEPGSDEFYRDAKTQISNISRDDLYSGKKHEIAGRPLSHIIDAEGLGEIDAFSLDVEGHEMEVLRGIDFEKHTIKAILVETKNVDAVRQFLQPHFKFFDQWTDHDYVFINRKFTVS